MALIFFVGKKDSKKKIVVIERKCGQTLARVRVSWT